jgi:hypothetical protein
MHHRFCQVAGSAKRKPPVFLSYYRSLLSLSVDVGILDSGIIQKGAAVIAFTSTAAEKQNGQ